MIRNVKHVTTVFGDIAYTEAGDGPPALFVHGVFLNGHLWRRVVERVADLRRCICVDLMAHGATQTAPDQDISFTGQAAMLAAFCDALGIDRVDMVANDSGGGIAQIFAADHSDRLRTLTLTNCDVHDNYPPPALRPLHDAVDAGRLGDIGRAMLANPDFARKTLAVGYEHPEAVSDETLHNYLAPLFSDPERTRLFERWFSTCGDNRATVAIEPALRRLNTPTLIVWGTGDVFFDVAWARWLHDTIPDAREPVLVEGAKLFFPEERPDALADPLRAFWTGTKQQAT